MHFFTFSILFVDSVQQFFYSQIKPNYLLKLMSLNLAQMNSLTLAFLGIEFLPSKCFLQKVSILEFS